MYWWARKFVDFNNINTGYRVFSAKICVILILRDSQVITGRQEVLE